MCSRAMPHSRIMYIILADKYYMIYLLWNKTSTCLEKYLNEADTEFSLLINMKKNNRYYLLDENIDKVDLDLDYS